MTIIIPKKPIQSFEDFLEDKAPGEVHTNNSSEGFENWLENLDVSEVMEFAEDYGLSLFKQGYIQGGIDMVNEKVVLASNIN